MPGFVLPVIAEDLISQLFKGEGALFLEAMHDFHSAEVLQKGAMDEAVDVATPIAQNKVSMP